MQQIVVLCQWRIKSRSWLIALIQLIVGTNALLTIKAVQVIVQKCTIAVLSCIPELARGNRSRYKKIYSKRLSKIIGIRHVECKENCSCKNYTRSPLSESVCAVLCRWWATYIPKVWSMAPVYLSYPVMITGIRFHSKSTCGHTSFLTRNAFDILSFKIKFDIHCSSTIYDTLFVPFMVHSSLGPMSSLHRSAHRWVAANISNKAIVMQQTARFLNQYLFIIFIKFKPQHLQ